MKKVIKKIVMPLAITVISVMSFSSCSNDDEPEKQPTLTEDYSGTYKGTITLNVAGQYSYDADISCVITECGENSITVTFPEYFLAGTMMGDMTLGSVTIKDIAYDNTKNGFFCEYGGEGLTQTMNGKTYPLNEPSSILVVKDKDGNLTIENPFTLGKMPLPLTSTFKGHK